MKKIFIALFIIISMVCLIYGLAKQVAPDKYIFSLIMNAAFLYSLIRSLLIGKITSPQGWKADIKETPLRFFMALGIPLVGYFLSLILLFGL